MFNDIQGLDAEQVATLAYAYLRGKYSTSDFSDEELHALSCMGDPLTTEKLYQLINNFLDNLWGVEEKGW